jgi:hypothetical protein
MRIQGAFEIKNMWFSLGDNKQHFIPNILDLFLKVGLIPIKQINDEIIPLFFDMMSSELLFTKPDVIDDNESIIDVLKVPNKLVIQLDLHFENGAGDYGFRDSFKKM